MDTKKWVRISPTRTDPTGSGYYRAEDGTYLYGNPRNGYMTLTLEEQQKRRLKAEAQREAETRRQINMAERNAARVAPAVPVPGGEGILGALLGSALVGVLLYAALLYGLALSLTTLWPTYLNNTIMEILSLFTSPGLGYLLPTLLHTVHIGVMAGLFVSCFKEISPEGPLGSYTSLYARRTLAVTFVISMLLRVIEGSGEPLFLSLFNGLLNGLAGIGYVALPALILYYREFHLHGEKGFLRHLARCVCERVPGTLIIALGILSILISFAMPDDITFRMICRLGGAFSILIGILGD